MSTPTIPPACPHEIRPGTTVCLHCAATARRAARAHTRRVVGRTAAAVAVAGGATLLAVSGSSLAAQYRAAMAYPTASRTPDSAWGTPDVAVRADSTATRAAAEPASSDPAGEAIAAPAASPAAAPPAPATPAAAAPAAPARVAPPIAPPIAPRLAAGRTTLGGGIVADRRGDTVRVLFDTPGARTRMAAKFEQTVRATLPVVYGAVADAALAGVPPGGLVGAAGLLGTTARGVRVPLAAGGALSLRPETRPGRDGPLVVAYEVVAAP